ncbi:MAG: dUTP diphosphatase [Candidatus Eisenbacteria bacterium]|uniref:Deoxyuridine 5'-triphosphate nucleotidohydrolase n=1 Tax=Eiseniibacteriota bacterium TaxID=2212470 RepID=A0A849SX65_UNCEI|nr:dUTP diphosphatase [Candidatus Eisenbacteria bacterium]
MAIRIQWLPHGEGLEPPSYATAGSAAADVRAAVSESITLAPGTIEMIPTGFALEIPPGWEVQIRPRSGLAGKHGVTLPNAPATIDSDYRGEIRVALINLGREPFVVERGMRIAQMLPAPVTRIAFEAVRELTTTVRGAGGFGHSGV